MPVVYYPPNLPLHGKYIFHRREQEDVWACPIPFIPIIVLMTALFLGGLWGGANINRIVPASIPDHVGLIVIYLLPPILLILIMLIVPQLSSPVWAYQAALVRDPDNRQLRWNLAVVATAHIYCGQLAQTEWLNLLLRLPPKDRFRALDYIKGVRSRLQQIPVIAWLDILIAFLAVMLVAGLSLAAFRDRPNYLLESFVNAFALAFLLQLFMLYLFVQRWQHIRRLMELIDIFEELLPNQREKTGERSEDEVDRWYREEQEKWTPSTKKSSDSHYPKAPWE